MHKYHKIVFFKRLWLPRPFRLDPGYWGSWSPRVYIYIIHRKGCCGTALFQERSLLRLELTKDLNAPHIAPVVPVHFISHAHSTCFGS